LQTLTKTDGFKPMKILVAISNVPDTTAKISFSDGDTKFNGTGVQYIIGPYEDFALARAVEIKEATGADITVINVGEADSEPTLRKALAIGADEAVRVNAIPIDGWFVANQIASFAKDKGFDLILTGRETIDHNGGVVHGFLGELLGIPSVAPVMKLDLNGNTATLQREIEGGKETVECSLPLVAGCQEPIAEWRIPNMRGIMSARTKPLSVLEPFASSNTQKNVQFQLPPSKGACKMIDALSPEQLWTLLKTEAKVL